MIFASKNERDVPATRLIWLGEKTVTRRLKPQPVGSQRAVQPGRGKKSEGCIEIISCMTSKEWHDKVLKGKSERFINNECDREARREGFGAWCYLIHWLDKHRVPIEKTYRIEFKRIVRFSEHGR